MPSIVDSPALIIIKGIADNITSIILDLFESPPFFHPNKSSINPTPATSKIVLVIANNCIDIPSEDLK